MRETIREAPAEAVKAAVKLKRIFMGIRLQRGTHTTQRKKATKVEKVKVKSQFNCNCSQTQAEQANQREKVNFAAGLLENTTKMKMKMKYSPISMVVALWCSRSLSLPLKRE